MGSVIKQEEIYKHPGLVALEKRCNEKNLVCTWKQFDIKCSKYSINHPDRICYVQIIDYVGKSLGLTDEIIGPILDDDGNTWRISICEDDQSFLLRLYSDRFFGFCMN